MILSLGLIVSSMSPRERIIELTMKGKDNNFPKNIKWFGFWETGSHYGFVGMAV